MWLFDKTSFTSTVAYDPSKDVGKSGHKEIAEASEDPTGMWLLVRARVKDDLEAVEKALQEVKGDEKFSIHVTTETAADYSYRALISRDDMKLYLSHVVDDIDYGSHFKEVVKANASQPTQRYSAMMGVWGEMARLQPYTPYAGYGGWDDGYYYGGTGSGKGKTSSHTSLIRPIKPFEPSTMWLRVDDVKRMLTEAGTAAWADDVIEALDDSAFEYYLAACAHADANDKDGLPWSQQEVEDFTDTFIDLEESVTAVTEESGI